MIHELRHWCMLAIWMAYLPFECVAGEKRDSRSMLILFKDVIIPLCRETNMSIPIYIQFRHRLIESLECDWCGPSMEDRLLELAHKRRIEELIRERKNRLTFTANMARCLEN